VSGLSAPPLPIGLPGRCAVERNRTSDHLLIRQALSPLSYHRPPPRYAAPQHKPQPKHPEARRTRLPLGPLPRTCPKGRVSCPQTPSAPTGTTISANKKRPTWSPRSCSDPGVPPAPPTGTPLPAPRAGRPSPQPSPEPPREVVTVLQDGFGECQRCGGQVVPGNHLGPTPGQHSHEAWPSPRLPDTWLCGFEGLETIAQLSLDGREIPERAV